MLARFGLDRSTLGVGLDIRDDAVLVSLVRRNRRVVGLGFVALPTGSVVRGNVREPRRLITGLTDLLHKLHVSQPPRVAVSLTPATPRSGLTVSAVSDAGGHIHAVRQTIEAARLIASSIGELSQVESTPISLVRFGRLANPDSHDLFLRGAADAGRWTARFHADALEVEIDPNAPTPAAATIGHDLRSLHAPGWGAIDLAADLRRTDTRAAATWAAAVGAAFGAVGVGPTVDLAAACDHHATVNPPLRGWAVEQVVPAT